MTRLVIEDDTNRVVIRSPGIKGDQGPQGDVPGERRIDTAAPLTGGGDLKNDLTLGIAVGTTAGTVAAGDDPRIKGSLPASTIDAKGDLIVGTANDLAARLPVGTAATPLLIPDAAAPGGLAWKAPADAGVVASSTVGNLLSPGMATSEDGVTVWRAAGGSPTITNDATYARTGTRSQKITTTTAAAIASPTIGVGVSQRIAVVPGRRYTFATWVRADTADENWLARLYWYTPANVASATVTTDGTLVTVSTTGWTLLMVSAVAPPDAGLCMPSIYRVSGAIGATVWADDASFHRGVGGVPSAPGELVVGTQPSMPVVVPTNGANCSLSAAQPVVVNYGGNMTCVLPNAVDNYGVMFTLINRGTGTITVSRPATDPRTINGLVFVPTIPGKGHLRLISTGDTWLVLDGEYVSEAVGKATYVWDPTANTTTAAAWWRLVKYDSGQRTLTLAGTWNQLGAGSYNSIQRTDSLVTVQFYADGGTADLLYNVPAGFQPWPATATGRWVTTGGTVGGDARYVYSDKTLRVYGWPNGATNLMLSMTWRTDNTLPTSLPGTQSQAPA